MTTLAYCGADGALVFGSKLPYGMLPVARCPKKMAREKWRSDVEGFCRLAYPKVHGAKGPSVYLIPGIPEAADESAALEALHNFSELLRKQGLGG
jgi:hypothetical protein